MPSAKVSLKRYKNTSTPKLKYTVSWPSPTPGESRKRRRFKTKQAALDFKIEKEAEINNAGIEGAGLKDKAIREAIWAAEKLEPFAVSIREAVSEWIERREKDSLSICVADAIPNLLDAKKKAGRSDRHLGTMRARLNRFSEDFGDRMLSGIEASEIETWLNRLNTGPVDRNNYRLYVSSLFGFAVKQKLARVNPVYDVDVARTVQKVEIYSPSELRVILNSAPADLLGFFAIGAFAGLRSSEIERLDWKQVDLLRGRMDLDGKGARHRYVAINDTLRAWLDGIAEPSGPVVGERHSKNIAAFRKELERGDTKEGRPVIPSRKNGLRHSYGSYELARCEDVGRVAALMGNSPSMIYKHYRERVTIEEAEDYFAVHPAKHSANPNTSKIA